MANELQMAEVQAVIALYRRGWSYRRIAKELGVHRETVARHVALAAADGSKPATQAPPGSGGREPADSAADPPCGEEPANLSDNAVRRAGPGRASDCEPFRGVILAKLEQGLSGRRIWQDLLGEPKFAASYHSVKRFIHRLGRSAPVPFRRMECAPGEEAQIDFGRGAPIVPEGGRRRLCHVFRIVLSHSRKAYSEVVWGKLIGDVPAATAILDRFLHHAEIPVGAERRNRHQRSARTRRAAPIICALDACRPSGPLWQRASSRPPTCRRHATTSGIPPL